MSTEDEVVAASETFYAALNRMLNGDASALADIWSHGAAVTTLHPVGGRDQGWDHVRASWEQVARLSTGGSVHLSDRLVQSAGEMAYEVGVEHGAFTLAGHAIAAECRVTNVYRREHGAWKIVHHHTDVSPAMVDALRDLAVKA